MKPPLVEISKKLLGIVRSMELYESYKAKLDNALMKVDVGYQRGQFNYFQYKDLISKLLRGRTRNEWIKYYDQYLLNLLKYYNYYISVFYIQIRKDTSSAKLHEDLKKLVKKKPIVEKTSFWKKYSKLKKDTAIEDVIETKQEEEETFKLQKPTIKPKQEQFIGLTPEEQENAQDLLNKEQKDKERTAQELETTELDTKPEVSKDNSMLNKILSDSKDFKPIDHDVTLRNPFSFEFIKHILNRISEKETFSSKTTQVPKELVDLQKVKSVVSEMDVDKIVVSNMTLEAKKFKKIISKKEKEVSKSLTSFGAIANILLKKWSLYLIELFPDFFKTFYNALKVGNVRILSSTYTNIMILSVLLVGIFSIFGFGIIFFIVGTPILQVVTKAIFMTILFTLTTFFIYYSYPYMKINSRRRNIRTNLPFAVNHMSAVASSGVAPDMMFRLLSKSEEYGAICVELMKVTEFIDIFGYDLVTAIKTVTKIVPAAELKEFFEGYVSTIETGGDLKDYLKQKAEEYMLTYKLERQKYNESISLYSDIYTGVLIAAPLFFVVALSLVNILGGKVGSINVELLITVGTYVAIPLLNILFIIFLEVSQPDV